MANGLQHTLITREIQDLDEKLKNIETMLTSACTQVNITILFINDIQFQWLHGLWKQSGLGGPKIPIFVHVHVEVGGGQKKDKIVSTYSLKCEHISILSRKDLKKTENSMK